MRLALLASVAIGLLLASTPVEAKRDDDDKSLYDPKWVHARVLKHETHRYNPKQTPEQNGAALFNEITSLKPGTHLEIEAGTYSVDRWFKLDVSGTEKLPIWITAEEKRTKRDEEPEFEQVVITRPDAKKNILDIGVDSNVEYVCLRGLEFTGGSHGIRIHDCENIQIDHCHIHHTGEVAISANTKDTAHLYLTRNDIHDTSGTGEGMYLGANHGKVKMRDSVIALNHIHDIGGEKVTQGDGIEIKQGSYGNLIAENHVHDTAYPCIIAYGTDGEAPNIIERNVCYNSGDNVMQVQGDAIVRNNLIMNGAGAGFSSHDHQGKTASLKVIHNTIISQKRGAKLSSWDNREGMVFANNAVYSEGTGVQFAKGSEGVTVAGNVIFGGVSGVSGGFSRGSGLGDFAGVTWDAAQRDARPPRKSTLINVADKEFIEETDINGESRKLREAGCYAK